MTMIPCGEPGRWGDEATDEPDFPWQELWKLRSEAIDMKAKNKIMLETLKETCRYCRQPSWAPEECCDCRIYDAILVGECEADDNESESVNPLRSEQGVCRGR